VIEKAVVLSVAAPVPAHILVAAAAAAAEAGGSALAVVESVAAVVPLVPDRCDIVVVVIFAKVQEKEEAAPGLV